MGVLIYEVNNYTNNSSVSWYGQTNANTNKILDLIEFGEVTEGVPTGTYYYILDINNGEEPLAGWIYLEVNPLD